MGERLDVREWRGDGFMDLGFDVESSRTPAIRGRGPGQEGWSGADRGEALATFLGWFSVGLGAMELIAPGQVGRMIGLKPGRASRTVIQAMGMREIGTGLGILANRRSKEWVGSRVGGDLMDLGLLTAALTRSEHPQRTLAAAAAVLGVSALDVLGAEQLSRSRRAPSEEIADEPGAYVQKSITIARPRAEVFAFWRDFANLPRFMEHLLSVEPIGEGRSRWRAEGPGGSIVEWEAETLEEIENEMISWRSLESSDLYNAGTVCFEDAPADRGTVVSVAMRYAPPGGAMTAAVLKLFRKEPSQQIADDLRRLRQVLETGDVVVARAEEVA